MPTERRKGGQRSDAVVDLRIEHRAWKRIEGLGGRIRSAARAALAALPAGTVIGEARPEVSVILVDDATIADLNLRFRGKDGPTNVLSFPQSMQAPHGPLLGDIVVAFETVMTEAQAEGKAVGDHLSHLIVHGTLHLCGLDHENEREATAMEALERSILHTLEIADPYGDMVPEASDRDSPGSTLKQ